MESFSRSRQIKLARLIFPKGGLISSTVENKIYGLVAFFFLFEINICQKRNLLLSELKIWSV